MSAISELTPAEVWIHFDKLCEIPRPSHQEQGVIEYIESLADQHGLPHHTDSAGNLIVTKPATAGMENCHGIILQGHLDMVTQKSSDSSHNFQTDPIRPFVDGDWVTADGTTLGADNGIGVAFAIAVLCSNTLKHPPIEALFTINEESGMTGALGLEATTLKGNWLLNIDTEEEGELYVGCAGGRDVVVALPLTYINTPKDLTFYNLEVSELSGGHSGIDIHKGRANANKISNAFLERLSSQTDVYIAQFDGGSLRNAIPRNACTTIAVPSADATYCQQILKQFTQKTQSDYQETDPHLTLSLTPTAPLDKVLSSSSAITILSCISDCPNGVSSWLEEMPDVVETSNNLARIVSQDDYLHIDISVRSAITSERNKLAQRIADLFIQQGASIEFSNSYPGWKPNLDS
ncbi:MAG: beta-Ala-His dipeptidase, partial [Methylococcales bacterium]|nr:beta-Ala-His dipeptidase [Methylococcales bacterium]